MSDFTVRSDNVDVEQIMRQIRARIREKRGVDYTEDEIRELANVKLEKFLDPKGVRSNLLEEYRRLNTAEAPLPNFAFEEDTLFETHRAPIRWLRALLRPFLKLLFNPNPLIKALHIQSEVNARNAEHHARVDALHYEVIHNLVVELTRTGIEVKSLKMRLESMASRLDFDERRARALEGVVQYRPGAVPPLQPPAAQEQGRRDQGRRDQGQRYQGSRDQGPRGPRDQGPRAQGPRDQGPRDQGSRGQESRDQGSRDQGPRDQGPRDQGSRDQAPTDQAPRVQVPPREPVVPGAEGTAPEGFQGNALDADGNERRARRRRRRGRRRPGDRPAFGEGSSQPGSGDTAEGGGSSADAGNGSTAGAVESGASERHDEAGASERHDDAGARDRHDRSTEGSSGATSPQEPAPDSGAASPAPPRALLAPPTPPTGDGGSSES
jgi:hypothetical protein